MTERIVHRIVALVRQAQELARQLGISNLLQPGLVKEMIIADVLGHNVIHSKRDADAHDPADPNILYEYLSCKEGGSGQFDRMFKEPAEERARSLERIKRNRYVFLAVFYKDDQLRIKTIYQLDSAVVLTEVERQLDRSRNAIPHVGLLIRWARKNGIVVYSDPAGKNSA